MQSFGANRNVIQLGVLQKASFIYVPQRPQNGNVKYEN